MDPLWVAILVGSVVLGLIATFRVMSRASKGYERARIRRAIQGPAIPCSTCGSTMGLSGVEELTVGSGGTALVGIDRTKGLLAVEVYRCPTCRKIELFLPPSAG